MAHGYRDAKRVLQTRPTMPLASEPPPADDRPIDVDEAV
jgi:hypothetical protein